MSEPRPGMGAIVHESGVAFRVWAPHADRVSVMGDFNGWSGEADPLHHEEGGYWYGEVEGATAGQEYKFLLGAGEAVFDRNDPYARLVTSSVGNGIVYDPHAFDWGDDAFRCPPHHELVIYETHIGSFIGTPDGGPSDLHDVTARLHYLKALGVNAVELMPVQEFAGDYSWGYNPAHPFTVESGYGGPDALKTFVKAAHAQGIAVILDVVYNHFGPSDLAIWQFDGWSEDGKGGIYFYNDARSSTPWGDTRPDYGRPEVRRYLLDNVHQWLGEFRLDGLRFDATSYMHKVDGGSGDIPEGWSLLREISHHVRERWPEKILIAEDFQAGAAVTSTEEGGAGFHAQWAHEFVHPVREALITPDDAHRSVPALAAAVSHHYGHPHTRVIYTESHDEVANGQMRLAHEIDGGNTDGWAAQKRTTLGAGLVLTAPGIPMIFQGQEFVEDEWFRDTVPLDWERAEKLRDIVRLYRDLIHLRRNVDGTTAALGGPHLQLLLADDEAKVLAFHRSTDDGQHAVVVANFAAHPREVVIGMPHADEWALRFNSDASTYSALFGDHPSGDVVSVEEPVHGLPARATVDVGPYSVVVYSPR